MTAVIPGNGHRTAIPRTAFRAFVTVVTALFQELGVYCYAIIAMHCIGAFVTVIPGTWHWHSAFVTVVTTLYYRKWTPTAMPQAAFGWCGYSNSKKWAIVIPRNGL